jgi:N utilization substance protein B
MGRVDRIVLRIAIYEITVARKVPVKAAINESIELAKTFSGDESGRFVNGVLGKVAETVA